MATLNQLADLVVQTLAQMNGAGDNTMTFLRRDAALLMCGLLIALAIGGGVIQRIRRSTPGMSTVVLPALLVREFGPQSKSLSLRYLAYMPFLAGLVLSLHSFSPDSLLTRLPPRQFFCLGSQFGCPRKIC